MNRMKPCGHVTRRGESRVEGGFGARGRKLGWLAPALVATLLLSGCALLNARQQSLTADTAGALEGKVVVRSPQKGAVILVRLENVADVLVVKDRIALPPDRRFRLSVLPGQFVLAAFIDVDGNGRFTPGEHGFYHPGPRIFTVAAKETVKVPDLVIDGTMAPPASDLELAEDVAKYAQNAGRVAALDDPVFSPANSAMGMWQPLDFLRQVGGGLFLLQEYEPGKIPIVFVHGMGGNPNDWRRVIEGVDRTRYQPWVFFYPSGVRLDMLSDAFVRQVRALKDRHGVERFAVAAHSMGGLVTRSFVKKYVEQYGAADFLFVMTVNSPMDGMASAAAGVAHSPIVLPAWRDVAVGSDFMKDLSAWHWPKEVPYHLVFSFQTGDSSDGTIPLESQLPLALQGEAVRLYGFHDSHVGTLSNQGFLDQFNAILREAADSTRNEIEKKSK